jgi:mono/diheme cytochrome c family protein
MAMNGFKAGTIVTAVAVVASVVAAWGQLQATPSLQTSFVGTYPAVADTKLDNCATCHMPVSTDSLNSYGLAVRDAKLRFKDIESRDSDGDGKTNLEEILALSYPGSFSKLLEYYVFTNTKGQVHFNHEMHISSNFNGYPGVCKECHGADKFPRRFDDRIDVRELSHQICLRCHQRSGKASAPTRCASCHEAAADAAPEKPKTE